MHLEAQVNLSKMHNLEIQVTTMATNTLAGKQCPDTAQSRGKKNNPKPTKPGNLFIVQKGIQLDQIGISDGKESR